MDARPVKPIGIIQEATRVYGAHFPILFPLALIVGLVQAILLFALRDTGAEFLAAAVTLLVSLVFQAFVVELLRDVRTGAAERSIGELLRSATPIVLPLLTVSVLAVLGILVGFVLLIVPGLILLTIWAVVVPVLVIERIPVLATFGRSRELVRGHGFQVFAVLLLVMVLVFVAAAIAAIFTSDPDSIAGSFVQLLISSAVAPIAALSTAVLYYRLVEIHQPAASPEAAAPAETL